MKKLSTSEMDEKKTRKRRTGNVGTSIDAFTRPERAKSLLPVLSLLCSVRGTLCSVAERLREGAWVRDDADKG